MRPLAAVLSDLAASEASGCDCRRVILYVLSGRVKMPAATISFGFDPDAVSRAVRK